MHKKKLSEKLQEWKFKTPDDIVMERTIQEAKQLEGKLAIYQPIEQKYSECCCAVLIPYISLNKKQCSECREWYEWELDEGQTQLFTDSSDKSTFLSEKD